MGSKEEYLRDIIANPQDDEPRLRFAAWLKDRGDARGDFIEIQCQLERLRPRFESRHHRFNRWTDIEEHIVSDDWPEYRDLSFRSELLLKAHQNEWLAGLPLSRRDVRFRRGFVEEVSMTAECFLRNIRRI